MPLDWVAECLWNQWPNGSGILNQTPTLLGAQDRQRIKQPEFGIRKKRGKFGYIWVDSFKKRLKLVKILRNNHVIQIKILIPNSGLHLPDKRHARRTPKKARVLAGLLVVVRLLMTQNLT